MNKELEQIISTVRSNTVHVLIVHGDIYGFVPFQRGAKEFSDFSCFFKETGAETFVNCLTYDLFSGVQICRGDPDKIRKAAGLEDSEESEDENTRLLNALQGQGLPKGGSLFPGGPAEVFAGLSRFLTNASERTIIILEYAETVFPKDVMAVNAITLSKLLGIALVKWARSREIKDKGHLIVLLAKDISGIDNMVLDRDFGIKLIPDNERDPDKQGPYAIWAQNTVEADRDFKPSNYQEIKNKGFKTQTLAERLIHEAKYFWENQNDDNGPGHLDLESATLASGSIYSNGNIPTVDFRFKVDFRSEPEKNNNNMIVLWHRISRDLPLEIRPRKVITC